MLPFKKAGEFPDRMSALGHKIVAGFVKYLLHTKHFSQMGFYFIMIMIIISILLTIIMNFRESMPLSQSLITKSR